MTRGMHTLLTLTSAVALTTTVGTAFARGTEEQGRPTWCGEVSHSGATWHRFSDGEHCRHYPHAEDQAGPCDIAPHPAGYYCAG